MKVGRTRRAAGTSSPLLRADSRVTLGKAATVGLDQPVLVTYGL